ncbi:MAG TPA: hypothetical protein VH374_03160 [Polyangia bacterium]|jgi:hypothetical protein|nr:hypothetical protein [Polyangia bacterium]
MDKPTATEELSKIGRFIQTYSSFLSSFVIGVAGLVATSIWQYRQSLTAAETGRSEQAIARTKADNDWRIARAEILSKNLNVLSSQGPTSADQRFGVLLSLTRGNIIDPELAVSYALELGKDNAGYMRAVLASTANKNYLQLAQAFRLTCLQRFGVQRAAEICKDDKLSDRSDSIAQVIQDETAAAVDAGAVGSGPMVLLKDEREVQAHPGTMSWLFEPVLQDFYERRQWKEIEKFEATSVGARLVAALVLATARTGELVTGGEAAALEKFHGDHRRWLVSYLGGVTCDPECRGKLVDVMLSSYGEAQGDYDEPLKKLLHQPRAEAGPALAAFHSRILWCQVDADDLAEFRDNVLVPATALALADPKSPATLIEDLVSLVAMVPDPVAGADPKAQAAWKALQTAISKSNEHVQRTYNTRKATAKRERANPPPMIKKVNFCGAAADSTVPVPKMDQ